MSELAEAHILSLVPYIASEPIDDDEESSSFINLASNENPLGPSKKAVQAALKSLKFSHLYPNSHRHELIRAICHHLKNFSVLPEQVALGNGTSELIVNLVRGVVGRHEAVLIGWPSFIVYRLAIQSQGVFEVLVDLDKDLNYDLDLMLFEIKRMRDKPVKMVIIANPNNPTGGYIPCKILRDFALRLPKDVVLVLDEAYAEYVDPNNEENLLGLVHERPRTVVLRTFSKIYGLAGMRLGYAVGCERVIDILERVRDPFNVNSVVQYGAIEALTDRDHVMSSFLHNQRYKPKLVRGLKNLGLEATLGEGNFVLAKLNPFMPESKRLSEMLFQKKVIIRPLVSYDMADYVRVSVGTEGEIDTLLKVLKSIL